MIPYETYKVLHILGVLLAFATLGGLALTVANGATKSTSSVRRLIGDHPRRGHLHHPARRLRRPGAARA